MSRLEIRCYENIEGRPVSAGEQTVLAGETKGINLLSSAKILVYGSKIGRGGNVLIVGDQKKIRAVRYEDEEDKTGKEMDAGHTIDVSAEQRLAIGELSEEVPLLEGNRSVETAKTLKKVIIYPNDSRNSGNREESPRGDFPQTIPNVDSRQRDLVGAAR